MKHDSAPAPRADLRAALRALPSVDTVLSHPHIASLRDGLPHALVTSAVREELDEIRERVRQGSAPDVSVEAVARGAGERVVRAMSPGLRPV
ncbi:MAG TPA: hypothetical protein VFR15_17390, partial [Chloroflexia bacterium]|nr:hypothetical protein [Chloroflexia bacterium]